MTQTLSQNQGFPKDLSVMTYNVWMDSHQLVKRMKKIIQEINEMQPDVVCLQEVHSPAIKKLFKEGLTQYHFMTSNHTKQTFKLYSYIPCIVIEILLVLCVNLLEHLSGGLFYLFSVICMALFCGSIIMVPQITRQIINRNLSEYDTLHEENQQHQYELDWVGQTILVKKSKFQECQIVKTKPFQTTAIIVNNSFNIFRWIYIWVLVSFLRPGYLIVKCKNPQTKEQILVCSCHLAIGLANQKRILQVSEMLNSLKQESSIAGANNFLLCGDFNADSSESEIQYLKKEDMRDVIIEKHGEKNQQNFYTWHNDNPYAKMMGHKENNARLDYIFVGNLQKEKNFKVEDSGLLFKQKNLSVLSDDYGVYSDHYGVQAKLTGI